MLNFYFLSEFSSKLRFDFLEDCTDPGIQSADNADCDYYVDENADCDYHVDDNADGDRYVDDNADCDY